MFVLGIIIALVISVIFSFILAAIIGWERPGRTGFWPSMWFVFLILFFSTWAGGLWLSHLGSSVGGVYWLSAVIVGFVVALLLAAIVPSRRVGNTPQPTNEPVPAQNNAVLGGYFWFLILALIIAIFIGYV